MSQENQEENKDNIVDASKPSAGRMYDYFLGGHHNFEVDRQAGNQLLKIMPFVVKAARLQRWAIRDIAEELSEKRGYDVIIDFASGLPTMDHVHHHVPQSTTVIYSDYDPMIVEYARDILNDVPNAYYFQADTRHPEELLSRPEVLEILAGRKKVAFILWGVAAFLNDEDITHTVQYLYDWAAPGSCLAFNAQGADTNPGISELIKHYEKMGSKTYTRPLKKFIEMMNPWKLDEKGFISLFEWHGIEQSELDPADVESFGPMGSGYGAYLTK